MLWQLTREALGQVHRVQPRSHLTPLLRCLLVLVPASAVGCGRLTRRRSSAALGALAGSALAVTLTLTLFRGGFGHESLGRLRQCAVTDPLVLSGDGLANLVLFAPVAFLAVLAIGRPWLVALGIAGISVGVEITQAVEWVGVCDTSDALHNTAGGLAAALVAAWLHRRLPVSGSGACPGSC